MQRKIIERLIQWKNSSSRKPLILQGARQVGKTWVMKEFGKIYYENVAYINFDNNEKIKSLFNLNYDTHRLIETIELETGIRIQSDKTLIIFDEIQECPKAITSLKYFNENSNEYHIIAAGSLLGVAHHSGTGFPVGKVEFLNLYPLSFFEFLDAMGEERFLTVIEKQDFEMISIFKDKFEELLKKYCYTGGMPEVVQDFIINNDYKNVRKIQKDILKSYEKDFSKHISSNTVEKVKMLWNSIPSQLTKENKKFIYNAVKKGSRAKDFETALTWLESAGLIYKVHRIKKSALPISAYEDFDAFKLFILDVGLLGAMTNIEAKIILERQSIFEEFKGSIAEQYVLQQLKNIEDLPIFYWSNETSRSEIDFIIQVAENIIPVEVKASINLQAKSLTNYIEKYQTAVAIRTSLADYKISKPLIDIPLYTIEIFSKICYT